MGIGSIRRSRVSAALVVVVLIFVAGCSTDNRAQEETTTTPQVARYSDGNAGGDTAQLTGKIVIESGCLFVEESAGGALVLPVLPDTKVSQANGGVRFGGEPLTQGTLVDWAGGYRDASFAGVEIPSECESAAGDSVQVFQVGLD